MKAVHEGQGEGQLTAAQLALISTGLPIAVQVARRLARTTRVLPRDELEAIARLAVSEVVCDFDKERGSWKSFVSTRVGFALCRALRKERRCSTLAAEDAIRAGLAHVEALTPCTSALGGSDEQAFDSLVALTSEVADAMALHLSMESEKTRALLRESISELEPLEGRVLLSHVLDRKSFRQIGSETGAGPSEAFRAFHRALAALRRKLH